MRYYGTIAEGEAIEASLKATGSYTTRKARREIEGQVAEQPSAFSVVYELYLTHAAKHTLESGAFLDALLYPHAVVRFMYFKRDGRAEVTVSNDKVVKMCALYPALAQGLATLQFCANNHRGVGKKYLTT